MAKKQPASKKQNRPKQKKLPKQKKKRQEFVVESYPLAIKLQVIEAEKTMSKKEIARTIKYKGKLIPWTTVRRILKNKDKILRAIDNGASPTTEKIRAPKFAEVESKLFEWIAEKRGRFCPLSGDLIKICLIFIMFKTIFLRKRRRK